MANYIRKKVKEHKKEIVITGLILVTSVGVFIGIKNRNLLVDIYKSKTLSAVNSGDVVDSLSYSLEGQFKETVPAVENALEKSLTKQVYEVSGHIRNLPLGYHASPLKLETAKTQGIELLDGQTLVETYTKGYKAA